MKLFFGCMSNDVKILRRILVMSSLPGHTIWQNDNPESAAKGLNMLLDAVIDEDVAVLVHHDLYIPPGWVQTLQEKLGELPDTWVVAGVYGIDERGNHCGKVYDRRTPLPMFTKHTFPQQATALDACCLMINLKKGFRFDETLEGFDLYDTYAALRARELGTAWIIDCPPEHYATRPFEWKPDTTFLKNWAWLKERFPGQKIRHTCCEENTGFQDLKNQYEGQTAWIIGKGPSLNYLEKEDIGDGPIFTMNENIAVIEKFDLPNPVYSLQIAGGPNKNKPDYPAADCDSRDCDHCGGMTRPQKATLIVRDEESRYCFIDYTPRHCISWKEIGMPRHEFTLAYAVSLAKFFGCKKLNILSCDAHVSGDIGCYDPTLFRYSLESGGELEKKLMSLGYGKDGYYTWVYAQQREIIGEFLEGCEVTWITPS